MSIVPSCADPGSFLYLASASPRRRDLLLQLGLEFECLPQALDESRLPGENALDYVVRLARDKANAGWDKLLQRGAALAPVLGADTAVVLGDRILGKPMDREDALEMLDALSGRWHRVACGVALRYKGECATACTETRVKFRSLDPGEATAYVATGEPMDKAGSYAVQGLGGGLVERIEGSYSGVVGLPLVETRRLLQGFGLICRW